MIVMAGCGALAATSLKKVAAIQPPWKIVRYREGLELAEKSIHRSGCVRNIWSTAGQARVRQSILQRAVAGKLVD